MLALFVSGPVYRSICRPAYRRRSRIELWLLVLILSAGSVNAQVEVNVTELSIAELGESLAAGQVTSVDLVQAYLERISAYDQSGPGLNSIVRINPNALRRAQQLDVERAQGRLRGPLHGIPIVVKDNYNTTFMPTTGGSVALADFLPTENATQVDLLRTAGVIVLAKTNLHEFAYGITSIGSLLGQTRNPYDWRRVPGGSSGGTGAAVAASFAAAGLGSDTCGSIRIPAAFNNLFGLRPSKGLSSIHGVMPLAHTQDVAGPLARSLDDLALILDVISVADANDSATALIADFPAPEFRSALGSVDPIELRLGRATDYMERADSQTRALIDAALDWYESQGAEIVEVGTAQLAELIAASGVIGYEFESDLNRYLSQFGSERVESLDAVLRQGLFHDAVSGQLTRARQSPLDAAAYASALAMREQLRLAIETLLQEQGIDALVYPTIAQTPVFIGSSQPGNNCSLSANSGLPALSMPVGFTEDGLPVGMELLSGRLQDASLLAMAYPYEQAIQPRRAPATTPALISGQAPRPRQIDFLMNTPNIEISGLFSVDITSNLLRYEVAVNSADNAGLHALTLAVGNANAGNPGPRLESVSHNLLGPGRSSGDGEIFMSPELRLALAERRLYVRAFAGGLPVSGISALLQSRQ